MVFFFPRFCVADSQSPENIPTQLSQDRKGRASANDVKQGQQKEQWRTIFSDATAITSYVSCYNPFSCSSNIMASFL